MMIVRVLSSALALTVLLAPGRGGASCASIEGCYCSFVANDDAAAVLAEVTASGDGTVDLQVEGAPLADPSGAVPDGAQIASLSCWSPAVCGELAVGYRGAFLVEVGAHEIAWVAPIVAERVVCEDFGDFEGLDRDQLASVLQADECIQALDALFAQLGYEQPPCKDLWSSCGCDGAGGVGPIWFGLGVLGLAGLRSIRRRPRSPFAR